MKTRPKESRVLFIMSKYAFIQILFGLVCIFAIQEKINIEWFILILMIGPGTLIGLIPYIASRIVQRRTRLGYIFSRNGVLIAHAGIGSLFALYLIEIRVWYAYLLPLIAILYGLDVIYSAFRDREKRRLNLAREGS